MKNSTYQHGVMLAILNQGVLITGEAGIGKSELAIALLDRGHQLVADDTVLLASTSERVIIGSCPQELYGWISVRGLGVLNIEQIWGKQALVQQQRLNLVIKLTHESIEQAAVITQPNVTELLNIPLPTGQLTTTHNRNLPLLVEVMIKSFINNNNSLLCEQFITKHQQWLKNNYEC